MRVFQAVKWRKCHCYLCHRIMKQNVEYIDHMDSENMQDGEIHLIGMRKSQLNVLNECGKISGSR